jgi:uncharacterized protein (TIGR02118 family)
MFKAMILLARRDGMTHDEFVDWWMNEHRPLASRLPGLRRLVFNDAGDTSDEIDGITELWFDSERGFLDAYATELGQRVTADSLAHVRSRQRLFVTEHDIVG